MAGDQYIFSQFTEDELKQVSQIKRFFERLQCDRELAEAVNQNRVLPEQLARLKETGVLFDLSELPLGLENQQNMMLYLLAVSRDLEEELDDEVKQFAGRYPLLKLWGKYLALLYQKRFSDKKEPPASSNAKFDAWRKRRVAAVKSELGFFGTQIDHPAFAYELSEGCSMGCWFCSFAPPKLSGVFRYNAERDSVLRIVNHCIDIFGKKTAGSALPYYRTEPHDNPCYISFLRDFEKLTGEVLCTSTAVCGDVIWLRELMDYYRREDVRYHWPRLSILSPAMMDKVHDAFTPEELLDIELLVQVKDHYRPKVTGGRILEEHAGLRDKEDFSDKNSIGLVPQGSIACVSGFNINLVTRTIMLFSPCYAGSKWPFGFRVFATEKYRDAKHFPVVINNLIERCMPLSPPREKLVKFRDDIVFRSTEEGFDLATPNQLHHFKGKDKCGPLGELIGGGEYTYEELSGRMALKHKVNPIVLRTVTQQLFDDGFLDEVY
ncbi:MAG: radical SAM family RiPP maturation amino acid epimerase [Synergistaceae bacterium]|nr:radical SAM family RiPP maturation amino acid epimerase [Synergistaceae bacterium]